MFAQSNEGVWHILLFVSENVRVLDLGSSKRELLETLQHFFVGRNRSFWPKQFHRKKRFFSGETSDDCSHADLNYC